MFARTCLALLFVTLVPGVAQALELAGVDVPQTAQIRGAEQPLVLNGAGVRKKFFISVYVGALYLPQRQVGVGGLLTDPPANRVSMHFVYSEIEKRMLDDGWREGFEKNLSPQELAAVNERLTHFTELFEDLHEGDTIWLDYVPGRSTEVSINGVPRGEIEGADFNAALLSVWLGDEPVTDALKNAMVGVDKH
ncbi:chalcone isomerase family protein [Thiosocius teredinicola]|uniref:chalcone isomerase family protein n=1 Tax=Thiosocius teredinicola TaxID=1973002 RepID=UPI0013DD997C